jgi:hypothetical protein
MAQRRQQVHDKGHKQGDGERGCAHDKGLCSHNSWPKKAGPSLDGGVLSVWVPTASRNSACARRNKGTTQLQGKGARAAMTAAAPAKRPARLEDRLSSDGGSARRRDAGQRPSHTNSEPIRLSPASARRPGPQQGEGFSAHLAFWTRRRGGAVTSSGTAWSRGSRAARSMASTATSPRCCSPAPWHSGELGEDGCRRSDVVKGAVKM